MRILKLAAMAAMANALDDQVLESEHPIVEASTIWPRDGWALTDWIVGFVVGAYSPLQVVWRNSDCRSQFFNMGLRTITYSRFFDKPFDTTDWVNWFGLACNLGSTAIAFRNMFKVCDAQYRDTFTNPWY